MSYGIAAIFVILGLTCILKPDLWEKIDQEHKAFATTQNPDDIEMTDRYFPRLRVLGVGSIIFGLLIAVDII